MISDVVNNNLQARRQPETALFDGTVHSKHIRKNLIFLIILNDWNLESLYQLLSECLAARKGVGGHLDLS